MLLLHSELPVDLILITPLWLWSIR